MGHGAGVSAGGGGGPGTDGDRPSIVFAATARSALVALWLGGMAMGVVVALAVLFGLHDPVLAVIHRVQLAASSSTVGHIQIVMGALALVVAAPIAVGFSARRRTPMAMPGDGPSRQASPTTFSRLSTRALDALQAGPPWISFLVGVGITTDLRYLAALTAILASGTALSTQFSAAAMYTVVALAYAEIPIAGHVAAPARTRAVMSHVHDWIMARRRGMLGAIVAVLGVFLVTTGMGHV